MYLDEFSLSEHTHVVATRSRNITKIWEVLLVPFPSHYSPPGNYYHYLQSTKKSSKPFIVKKISKQTKPDSKWLSKIPSEVRIHSPLLPLQICCEQRCTEWGGEETSLHWATMWNVRYWAREQPRRVLARLTDEAQENKRLSQCHMATSSGVRIYPQGNLLQTSCSFFCIKGSQVKCFQLLGSPKTPQGL